jgi:hypothetical protein
VASVSLWYRIALDLGSVDSPPIDMRPKMRRTPFLLIAVLMVIVVSTSVRARQPDPLEGRWQGTLSTLSGRMPAEATFLGLP